jgi:hypothetical protein
MKRFIIEFQSKTVPENRGYFYRPRKVGFSSVYNIDMARKFKTEELARRCLQHLEEVEGEWYTFEIKMIEI